MVAAMKREMCGSCECDGVAIERGEVARSSVVAWDDSSYWILAAAFKMERRACIDSEAVKGQEYKKK